MLEKIKKNPRFKHFLIGLISSHKNPRPRLWVRWFVNPFVHKKGRGAVVRSRRSKGTSPLTVKIGRSGNAFRR